MYLGLPICSVSLPGLGLGLPVIEHMLQPFALYPQFLLFISVNEVHDSESFNFLTLLLFHDFYAILSTIFFCLLLKKLFLLVGVP